MGVQEAQQKLQSLEVFSEVEVLLDAAKGTNILWFSKTLLKA